jgi:hypothetical protein
MTEETKAGLKLLAEYMELEKLPKYLQWISSTGYLLDLKYNKSWDWLIPVYAIVLKDFNTWNNDITAIQFRFLDAVKNRNIRIAFEAVVELVKLINKEKGK